MEEQHAAHTAETREPPIQLAVDAIRNYHQVNTALVLELGHAPDDRQLASGLGLSADEASMLRMANDIGLGKYVEQLPAQPKSQGELRSRSAEFATLVQEAFMAGLSDRQQRVLSLYYGLDHNYRFSNRQLHRLLGVSEQRTAVIRYVAGTKLLSQVGRLLRLN